MDESLFEFGNQITAPSPETVNTLQKRLDEITRAYETLRKACSIPQVVAVHDLQSKLQEQKVGSENLRIVLGNGNKKHEAEKARMRVELKHVMDRQKAMDNIFELKASQLQDENKALKDQVEWWKNRYQQITDMVLVRGFNPSAIYQHSPVPKVPGPEPRSVEDATSNASYFHKHIRNPVKNINYFNGQNNYSKIPTTVHSRQTFAPSAPTASVSHLDHPGLYVPATGQASQTPTSSHLSAQLPSTAHNSSSTQPTRLVPPMAYDSTSPANKTAQSASQVPSYHPSPSANTSVSSPPEVNYTASNSSVTASPSQFELLGGSSQINPSAPRRHYMPEKLIAFSTNSTLGKGKQRQEGLLKHKGDSITLPSTYTGIQHANTTPRPEIKQTRTISAKPDVCKLEVNNSAAHQLVGTKTTPAPEATKRKADRSFPWLYENEAASKRQRLDSMYTRKMLTGNSGVETHGAATMEQAMKGLVSVTDNQTTHSTDDPVAPNPNINTQPLAAKKAPKKQAATSPSRPVAAARKPRASKTAQAKTAQPTISKEVEPELNACNTVVATNTPTLATPGGEEAEEDAKIQQEIDDILFNDSDDNDNDDASAPVTAPTSTSPFSSSSAVETSTTIITSLPSTEDIDGFAFPEVPDPFKDDNLDDLFGDDE